jgi:hypothetical protein
LVEIAEEQLMADKDPALEKMLKIAKRAIPNSSSNSYHQKRRDQFAVNNSVFYYIRNADIVMVLDKNTNVISFQCNYAIRQLLGKVTQQMIIDSFEKYSTLAAVPLPDITRHGLHWTDFLPQNSQFDPRNPDSDIRKAKSGVYHFGGHCATADWNGKRFGVTPTADSGERLTQWPHVAQQQEHLRYSALGACIEVLKFFFRLLDPELLEEYEKAAREIAKLENIPFQTRRDIDPFIIKALLVNVMTNEHKDLSDWKFGFAALVPVGDFTGGDLLLRELGLRIEAPSGCIQFMRGHELAHSIAKWEGRRFVVVAATHEAVRRFAQRQMESTPEGKLPLQRGRKRDHKEVD